MYPGSFTFFRYLLFSAFFCRGFDYAGIIKRITVEALLSRRIKKSSIVRSTIDSTLTEGSSLVALLICRDFTTVTTHTHARTHVSAVTGRYKANGSIIKRNITIERPILLLGTT